MSPLMRYQKKRIAKAERAFKQISIPSLVKKLDEVFSLYRRLQEADKNGMVKCFTSGKVMFWKQAQAGHYISRRHYATRWDERNVQVQSVAENIFNQGNAPAFALKLIEKYGKDILTELEIKKNCDFKLERFNLQYLIAHYQNKVLQLKDEKGL